MSNLNEQFRKKVQSRLCRSRLDEDRKFALLLLAEAAKMGATGEYPSAPEPDIGELLKRFGENLECMNCGAQAQPRYFIYCGELCHQTCKHVRYIRRCISDGRIWRRDIQSAIGTRLLTLNDDGYPAAERYLSKAVRQQVFARDNNRCACCGKPADEIDHIDGSSNELGNLRAICGACNRAKAFADARLATPEEAKAIEAMWSDIAKRIASPTPLKFCDCGTWEQMWRKLGSVRKVAVRQQKLEAGGATGRVRRRGTAGRNQPVDTPALTDLPPPSPASAPGTSGAPRSARRRCGTPAPRGRCVPPPSPR